MATKKKPLNTNELHRNWYIDHLGNRSFPPKGLVKPKDVATAAKELRLLKKQAKINAIPINASVVEA